MKKKKTKKKNIFAGGCEFDSGRTKTLGLKLTE